MTVAALSAAISNATFLRAEMLPRLRAGKVDARTALEFCALLRQRGIAELLLNGAADEFLKNLRWSGRAFLHVLPRLAAAELAASRQPPFFDALVAGDFETAAALARATRTTRNAELEYEESFLYAIFLQRIVLGDGPSDDLASLVTRWESLVEATGDTDPRLDICRAWLARDAVAISNGIEVLLRATRDRYLARAQKDSIADEELSTEGAVSVEGLALVRLARQQQLSVRDNYRMAPSLVWRAESPAGPADDWMTEE